MRPEVLHGLWRHPAQIQPEDFLLRAVFDAVRADQSGKISGLG